DPRSARLHNPDQFRRADRSRLVAKMGVKIGRRSGVILARRLTGHLKTPEGNVVPMKRGHQPSY
ncbi:MAG: hypothetical protein LCH61_01250, partial [Proteobacteria bacterium]|nr:hypothetical protein [Pseudomonadota bacterium]